MQVKAGFEQRKLRNKFQQDTGKADFHLHVSRHISEARMQMIQHYLACLMLFIIHVSDKAYDDL